VLDLQGAAEADEIAGRADMLVGHEPAMRGWERFVNIPDDGVVRNR
jgi:hypothetical protein